VGAKVFQKLKTVSELRDVNTDQQTAGLRLDVQVDATPPRAWASPRSSSTTRSTTRRQRQVATTYTQVNQYRVVLEVKPEFQNHPDALQQLYVRSATGAPVRSPRWSDEAGGDFAEREPPRAVG